MNFKFNTVFVYFLSNGRMLVPGNNVIPEAEAKELLKTKDVQERIRIGQITVSKDADFEEIKEETF